MLTLSRWKFIVVAASIIFGLLFALPNVLPASVRDSMPGFLPRKTLNLGLDLQGGSYLLLEVDLKALRKEKVTNLIEEIRKTFREEQIRGELSAMANGVRVTIVDPAQADRAFTLLSRQLPQPLRNSVGTDLTVTRVNPTTLQAVYSDEGVREQASSAVEQSITIIRKRLDPDGNKEIPVTRQGEDRIVVQAPGESDPEKLKALIGRTAKMTFQMVDENVDAAQAQAGRLPPGTEILPTDNPNEPFLVVSKRAEVTGEMLTSARSENDPETGADVVAFRFNSVGARRFGSITSRSVGKRFAIVLDRQIISAPEIQTAITGGSGVITGSFNAETAHLLAVQLNAGALPAPLKVEESPTAHREAETAKAHRG